MGEGERVPAASLLCSSVCCRQEQSGLNSAESMGRRGGEEEMVEEGERLEEPPFIFIIF